MWGDWGVARGLDGIRQTWSRWYEAFEDVQIEFGEVAEIGDNVVVTYPLYARGRASGAEVNQPFTLGRSSSNGLVAFTSSSGRRARVHRAGPRAVDAWVGSV